MAVNNSKAAPITLQQSTFRFPALRRFRNFVHGISRRRAPDITSLRELNFRPEARLDGGEAARHRILFCNALEVELDKTVWFAPSPTGPVLVVTRADAGKGARDWATRITNASGLVTKETDVFLATLLNDNVVVLLFDPRWYVTGVVSIDPKERNLDSITQAVDLMVREGGAERKEIEAFLSPSLGPCCYEFKDPSLPGAHNRTNLWDIVRGALTNVGILRNRVLNPRLCSSCKPFDFYSVFEGGEGSGANAIVAGTRDTGNFGEVLARRRASAAVYRRTDEKHEASLKEISLSLEERRLNNQMKCPYGRNQVYIRSVLTGDTDEMVDEPVISLRCAIIEHVGLAEGGYNIVDKEYIEYYCCGRYQECEAYKLFTAEKDRRK